MILIFVLVWFSALWSMEQEKRVVPEQKKPASISSLLNIAQRAVYSYILDKKITVNDVQQFPPVEQELIEFLIKSDPKEVKTGEFYYTLDTITPDHRYILVRSNQGLLRIDLYTNQTVKVDELKENNLKIALSPSGNLAALISSEKIWIKDIVQNKVIAEKSNQGIMPPAPHGFHFGEKKYTQMPEDFDFFGDIFFIGEKELLISDHCNTVCLSVEKKLASHRQFIDHRYLGMLPAAQEYMTYKYVHNWSSNNHTFFRMTLEGTIKNQTMLEDLKEDHISLTNPMSAIYEPEMLVAFYLWLKGQVCVVSLKNWPTTVTSSAQLRCSKDITICALAFANKGQWLIVVDRGSNSGLTIWDWKNDKQLYTYKVKGSLTTIISYTDCPTPYPCLFESYNVLYSFDPIKAVTAAMLFPSPLPQTAATSNDNSNNNVSNDNGAASITSRETSKQDSAEKRHKRPKK